MDNQPDWTPEQREYLSTLLHELRSPLMSILGLSEGLADDVFVNEKHDEVVDIIVENAKHMTSIAEAFSESLKQNAPYRSVVLSPKSLTLLVSAACSPAWLVGAGPHHGERVDITVRAKRTVELDPMRLRRVITNLVENALRHTSGPVEVIVDERDLCLVVEVLDRGSGISQRTMNGKGDTGLGISIVQNLVYAMRGSIEWLSRDGGGTRVRAELPFVGQHQ